MRCPVPILLAISSTTLAVELYDFEPRIETLGSKCDAAYKQNINGCTKDDFGEAGCSVACLEGLRAFEPTLRAECASEDFGGSSNLVVIFMAGDGPQNLCRNYKALVASSSTSKATVRATSATATFPSSSRSTSAASTSVSSSSIPRTTSMHSMDTSAASSQPTPSTTSGGLLIASSTIASSTSPTATSTPTRGNGSGGGSPFDSTSNNLNSSATSVSVSVTIGLLTPLLVLLGAMW